MEKFILRYRPLWNKKAQLILRTHDLSGTDYQHIRYVDPEEVLQLNTSQEAHFLYSNEHEAFYKDHPEVLEAA